MPWITPKTWATGELVTAADLNTHVRDNLDTLKNPPGGIVTLSSNITTNSGSFVDVTGASVTLTPGGGDVFVSFAGTYVRVGNYDGEVMFDVAIVDGGSTTRVGGTEGIVRDQLNTEPRHIAFVWWIPKAQLTAGAKTIKLQWKVGGGSQRDVQLSGASSKAQFTVREVS